MDRIADLEKEVKELKKGFKELTQYYLNHIYRLHEENA